MSKEIAVRLTRAKSFKTAMLLAFILLMLSAPYEAFAAPLFQEDFESGSFSKFSFVWRDGQGETDNGEQNDGQAITNGGTVRGNVGPAHVLSHTGKRSFQDHYTMNSSGPAHDDNNHMISIYDDLSGGPIRNNTRIFVRGYLYFPADTKWAGTNNDSEGLQRKFIYFKSRNWGKVSTAWGAFLGSWSTTNGMNLRFGYGLHGGTGATLWNLGFLTSGKWYCIEVELKLGAYGQDEFRLWVDGVLKKDARNLVIRSQDDINNDRGLGSIEFGRQVDRYNSNPFDEYRYWDDIVVDTQYIGPMDTVTPVSVKPASPVLYSVE